MKTTYFLSFHPTGEVESVEELVQSMKSSILEIFTDETNISSFTKGKASSSSAEAHITKKEGAITAEVVIEFEGESKCALDKGKITSLIKAGVGRSDIKFEKKCIDNVSDVFK